MQKEELLAYVPFIYHLTDKRNVNSIYRNKKIFSTNSLVDQSTVSNKEAFKTTRRPQHEVIDFNGSKVTIRDQRPLNAAVDKCLTHGWKREQFIHLLNSRVFFWPNLKRLHTHFGRYENESPIIFKIELQVALTLNPHVQLCHLNSGATRPLGMLGGKAPERGPNTFVNIDGYDKGLNKLAEVTFPDHFLLPATFLISEHPDGPWITKTL